MKTLSLLAAALLAAAATPALAGRCEPPPQQTANGMAVSQPRKPTFGCPTNPQLLPAAFPHRMKP